MTNPAYRQRKTDDGTDGVVSTDSDAGEDILILEKSVVNDSIASQNQGRPLRRDLYLLLRHWLSQRRVQLALGAVLLGLGAWFNWEWLVAAGMAPLILAFAPCAVMCLMGMCMHKGDGKGGCHGSGDKDKSGPSSGQDS
ncbi:hypothetical protein [Sedimenticola selenatireducens]|uniref:hypothetical protein n=1 Tax=Sedimenticola selenatireducens TaxID=191960 RepID=UPI0006858369|nr:hypothetical protein [Sedimenticola selenatireducens]